MGGKAKEYSSSIQAVRSILRNEGVSGIYSGLSAGLLRQATYTTTRLGVYTALFDYASQSVFVSLILVLYCTLLVCC